MLNKEDVLHVAKLARLDLSADEKEKYSSQLSAVFESFNELDKIDTTGVPETSQVTGRKNVSRPDEIKVSKVLPSELLENVPLKDLGKILVPKVIDR